MFEDSATGITVTTTYVTIMTICLVCPCLYSLRRCYYRDSQPLSQWRITMQGNGDRSSGGNRVSVRRNQQGEAVDQLGDIEEQRISRRKLKEEQKKTQLLLENLKGVRTIVEECHFIESETTKPDPNLIFEGIQSGEIQLTFPNSCDEESSTEERRRFSDSCAICLARYSPGETIVWSSNPECSHAFHEACILRWLLWLSKLRSDLLCPCCRGNFVMNTDKNINENICLPGS